MQRELVGSVPKLPYAFARTLINRAWREIRERNLWSFNLYEFAWITPPPIQAGLATVIQGSNQVTFDATATAAINAGATLYSAISARQFRVGISQIYNIIGWDGAGTATLDRIFADPSSASASYLIYQVYYVPPFRDHLALLSVRNMQMFLDLDLTATRADIDARDPQRSWYQFPTYVVPFGIDIRGQGQLDANNVPLDSSTLGYPFFELWGQPINVFNYDCYALRRNVDLTLPADTLPMAVGEDLVLAKAKWYAYEWSEANKGMAPRAVGPDFKFLMGKVADDFKKLLINYRRQDKELVNNWFSVRNPSLASRAFGYYNTIAGVAGPYTQP